MNNDKIITDKEKSLHKKNYKLISEEKFKKMKLRKTFIATKTQNYFKNLPFITKEHLPEFISSINLNEIFQSESEQLEFWEQIQTNETANYDSIISYFNFIYDTYEKIFTTYKNIDEYLNSFNNKKECLYSLKFINELFFKKINDDIITITEEKIYKIIIEIKTKYKFIHLSDEEIKIYINNLSLENTSIKQINKKSIDYINNRLDEIILNNISDRSTIDKDNEFISFETTIEQLTVLNSIIINCIESMITFNDNKSFLITAKNYIERYIINSINNLYEQLLEINNLNESVDKKDFYSESSLSYNVTISKEETIAKINNLITSGNNNIDINTNNNIFTNKKGKPKATSLPKSIKDKSTISVDNSTIVLNCSDLSNGVINTGGRDSDINTKIQKKNKSPSSINYNDIEEEDPLAKQVKFENSPSNKMKLFSSIGRINKNNNYDFKYFSKDKNLIDTLGKNGDKLIKNFIFTDDIYLRINKLKKQKFLLVITTKNIYILKNDSEFTCVLKEDQDNLQKVIISLKNFNMLYLSFNSHQDVVIESFRRIQILSFLKLVHSKFKFKELNILTSNNFKIRTSENIYENIFIKKNKLFPLTPNFENALKMGILMKYQQNFFRAFFQEKLVILSLLGLMYFDEADKVPKMLIPLIGTSVKFMKLQINETLYCFKLKTINDDTYIFGSPKKEETLDWLKEFVNYKKVYHYKMKNIAPNFVITARHVTVSEQ